MITRLPGHPLIARLLLFAVLATACLAALSRDWIYKGMEVDGELIKVDGNVVYIRRSNGKMLIGDLGSFSGGDQVYIEQQVERRQKAAAQETAPRPTTPAAGPEDQQPEAPQAPLWEDDDASGASDDVVVEEPRGGDAEDAPHWKRTLQTWQNLGVGLIVTVGILVVTVAFLFMVLLLLLAARICGERFFSFAQAAGVQAIVVIYNIMAGIGLVVTGHRESVLANLANFLVSALIFWGSLVSVGKLRAGKSILVMIVYWLINIALAVGLVILVLLVVFIVARGAISGTL